MGYFAQVPNGDKQFWKLKFYAANEKAKGLVFLLGFSFGEGGDGGEWDFLFLVYSQCVP